MLVILLFCYLGLFTWNARTGYLDTLAERSGLEIVGYVLSPIVWVKGQCSILWNKYIALIDVAEENALLREELRQARLGAMLAEEDREELKRLRSLFQMEPLHGVSGTAARVIAKRFGPQAVLQTCTINKGYLDGAIVGTPVITEVGVVGRVLRAAPHASTVILLTDPEFRLSVITQADRIPGILSGGMDNQGMIEMTYVSQTAHIEPGDLLVTAGMGGLFPKGIPVGIVVEVRPANQSLFQRVRVRPLTNLDGLEEVLLLPEGEDKDASPTLPDSGKAVSAIPLSRPIPRLRNLASLSRVSQRTSQAGAIEMNPFAGTSENAATGICGTERPVRANVLDPRGAAAHAA